MNKIINRTTLKYFAAFAMVLDHICMAFFSVFSPLGFAMRTVGRLTAPIMCMFLAEGFKYTSSKSKYALRLGIFAVISQFSFAYFLDLPYFGGEYNVIFTFFLCFMMLWASENTPNPIFKAVIVLLTVAVSYQSDWAIVAPLWVAGFYFTKTTAQKIGAFTVGAAAHIIMQAYAMYQPGGKFSYILWQLGVFLFIPVLLMYKPKREKTTRFSKWFFYIFYPLHLAVLAVAERLF